MSHAGYFVATNLCLQRPHVLTETRVHNLFLCVRMTSHNFISIQNNRARNGASIIIRNSSLDLFSIILIQNFWINIDEWDITADALI